MKKEENARKIKDSVAYSRMAADKLKAAKATLALSKKPKRKGLSRKACKLQAYYDKVLVDHYESKAAIVHSEFL